MDPGLYSGNPGFYRMCGAGPAAFGGSGPSIRYDSSDLCRLLVCRRGQTDKTIAIKKLITGRSLIAGICSHHSEFINRRK